MNNEIKKVIDEDIENSLLIKIEDLIRDYIVSLDVEFDSEEYVETHKYILEQIRHWI